MPNLLITSAGRRVSLVKYFQQEAKACLGAGAKVFTTDLTPQLAPACLISDGYFTVGRFADAGYMDTLLDICKQHGVKLVVPTLDTELELYTQHRAQFAAEGIELLVSDKALVNIFRDKFASLQFFRDRGIATPRLYDKDYLQFPLFIKPIKGSSSKGAMCINHKDELSPAMLRNDSLLFMEYLSPEAYEEYTVDLYYNRRGELKGCVPRLRMEVRSGEMSKGMTCSNHIVPFVEKHFSHLAGARGCITLQVFSQKVTGYVIASEMNLRFGGGYPLSHLAGANYVRCLMKEYLLHNEVESVNNWQDGVIDLRYDSEMIVGS